VGPVPDADPLDELASALLDGEATEAERARATEPEVARRVAAFEALALRVGSPVEPPAAAARDRAIAAALDAPPELAEPVPISSRRRLPAWLPTLGAAAAMIAVVAAVGLVASSGNGDDDETAGGDADTAETVFEEAAGAAGSGSVADLFSVTADLGDLATTEELADALRPLATERAAATTSGAGAATEAADDEVQSDAAAPSAGPLLCSDRFGPDVLTVATARLAGRPVVAAVLQAADGSRSFVALDAETCELVAEGSL